MATWYAVREDGESRVFAAWHIENVVKRCVSQDIDSAEVIFRAGSIQSSCPWDYDESIEIRRNSTVFFRGNVKSIRVQANAAGVSMSVILYGPWWHLEHLVYTQPVDFVTDSNANPTPAGAELALSDFTTEQKWTSQIFLGQDLDGNPVDSKAMLTDILSYAQYIAEIPIQIGTIDDGIEIPLESYEAITCAEAIRKCLRWTPDQTTRIDYTTNPPTIHIRSRENLSPATVTIPTEVEEVELEKRTDLQISGLRLEYIQNNERENFTFRTQVLDEAGTNPTGIGSPIVPIELFGSYLFDGSVVAAEEPPVGIAQTLYDFWSQVFFEGRVKIVRQDATTFLPDCIVTDWLNFTLNVAGGFSEWATMNAVVQASTDDIASGRTELIVGFPQHLSAQDLFTILRNGKTNPPTIPETLAREGGSPGVGILGTGNNSDGRLTFGPTSGEANYDFVLYKHKYTVFFNNGQLNDFYHWDWVEVWSKPGGVLVQEIKAVTVVNPPFGPSEFTYSQTDAPGIERHGKAVWTYKLTVFGIALNFHGASQEDDHVPFNYMLHKFYLNGSPTVSNSITWATG